MKNLSVIAAAVLLSVGAARADLYIASGINSGVTSHFDFTLDAVSNQLLLEIDNSYAGPGGVTGTLTCLGFNLPDDLAASMTLVSQSWLVLNPGHDEPDDWTAVAPFELNAGGNQFDQDVGLITGMNGNGGNPNRGIQFGEVVRFVFQFGDFEPSDFPDFLGMDGVTARWQQVTAGPGSDEGFGNFTPVPEPTTYGVFAAGVLLLGVMARRLRPSHA